MELFKKIIKPEIINLNRMKDTHDERYDFLRLDKNERIIPFDHLLLNELKSSLTSEVVSGYAELGKVYRKLASYLGINTENLLITSGSDLAIKSVFESCISKNDEIILHLPSYGMYRVYANMFGAYVRAVPLNSEWKPDIDKMLSMINPRTKFLAIENPNGFVGSTISKEDIEKLCKKTLENEVILFLDEAYHYVENSENTSAVLIDKYPNVIITQTFSKGHGLAGLRLGYLIAHESLMKYIERVRPMHEISSFTAVATEWMLDHPEILKEYQIKISKSKEILKLELLKLDIDFRINPTNFFLINFRNEKISKDISKKFYEKKILIRRPFDEELLKGWCRICIGDQNDTYQFLNALNEILKENNLNV